MVSPLKGEAMPKPRSEPVVRNRTCGEVERATDSPAAGDAQAERAGGAVRLAVKELN